MEITLFANSNNFKYFFIEDKNELKVFFNRNDARSPSIKFKISLKELNSLKAFGKEVDYEYDYEYEFEHNYIIFRKEEKETDWGWNR